MLSEYLEAGTFSKVVILSCLVSQGTHFFVFFCIGYKSSVNFEEMCSIGKYWQNEGMNEWHLSLA